MENTEEVKNEDNTDKITDSNFKNKLEPRNSKNSPFKGLNFSHLFKESNLFWVFVAGIFALFIWNIPIISFILYPFKLFVTYVHEASHGVAAIITGGHFLKLTMEWDTSGLAYTSGGWRVLVISAGYLGSSIFGGLLFLVAFRKGWEKVILIGLGAFFLICTILFARNPVALVTGFTFGILFLILIKYSNKLVTIFIGFLAIQNCFYSFVDLSNLFNISVTSNINTDAMAMSQELTKGVLPAPVFVLVWLIMSIIIFIVFLQIINSHLRSLKNEE